MENRRQTTAGRGSSRPRLTGQKTELVERRAVRTTCSAGLGRRARLGSTGWRRSTGSGSTGWRSLQSESLPIQFRLASGSSPSLYQVACESLASRFRVACESLPGRFRFASDSLPIRFRVASESLPGRFQAASGRFQVSSETLATEAIFAQRRRLGGATPRAPARLAAQPSSRLQQNP